MIVANVRLDDIEETDECFRRFPVVLAFLVDDVMRLNVATDVGENTVDQLDLFSIAHHAALGVPVRKSEEYRRNCLVLALGSLLEAATFLVERLFILCCKCLPLGHIHWLELVLGIGIWDWRLLN